MSAGARFDECLAAASTWLRVHVTLIRTVRATKQQTEHTSILRDAPQRTAPTTSTTSTAQQPLRQREQKQEQPEAQQEHQQEQDWHQHSPKMGQHKPKIK